MLYASQNFYTKKFDLDYFMDRQKNFVAPKHRLHDVYVTSKPLKEWHIIEDYVGRLLENNPGLSENGLFATCCQSLSSLSKQVPDWPESVSKYASTLLSKWKGPEKGHWFEIAKKVIQRARNNDKIKVNNAELRQKETIQRQRSMACAIELVTTEIDELPRKRKRTSNPTSNEEISEKDEDTDTNNTPPHFTLISSDSESDEDDNTNKEEESSLEINLALFDVDQSKGDSEWKLQDGQQLVKVLNRKTSEMVKQFSKKDKKQRTLIVKSVIKLGLSSIIDLSSEFKDGMYTWFEKDWAVIKRKVYKIVDMKPKGFEGEVKNVIDIIEEMCDAYKYNEARDYLYKIKTCYTSQTLIQIANIYFYVIDKYLKNAFIFVDKSGKCQELSEIEYAIEMIAPIMSEIFNDTSEYINLRWGEKLSNVMSDRRRKIDLRIIRIADKLELSHSECAKVPLPTKIVHDRSKFLRTLKGILNNFLKEDLSDEVRDSKILGIQFYGLYGQIIGVDLIDDGLYFGLEGSSFEFPTQLTNIKCLRNALEALFFFK
ncbi:11675_t:CDS:2, partial [Funneliformis caledonium]